MAAAHSIQYITRDNIDKIKWDSCVEHAPNGLIYAYSFYLDCMAMNWDALVLGDYEAVMPLCRNKKYGFHYLYQPAFTAQLGVFGKNIDNRLINAFINAIPDKFRFIEIHLNNFNIQEHYNEFNLRINYVLRLNNSYEQLQAAYRENHIRNIKKAVQSGCSFIKEIPVDEIIHINRAQLNNKNQVAENDYNNFAKLYYQLKKKQQAATYAISNARQEILASCVFFFSNNRAYYILVGNTPDGKTIGASHALIDYFIRENAGKNLLLDFEGSDIPGLANFYSGFGATEELYPFLKINKLPFYIKWLKK